MKSSRYTHGDHSVLPPGLRSLFKTLPIEKEEVGWLSEHSSPVCEEATSDTPEPQQTKEATTMASILMDYLDDGAPDVAETTIASSTKRAEVPESPRGQNLLTFIEEDDPEPKTKTKPKKLLTIGRMKTGPVPRWEKEMKNISTPVKQDGVVFLPLDHHIPNMGWDSADKYPGTTPVSFGRYRCHSIWDRGELASAKKLDMNYYE